MKKLKTIVSNFKNKLSCGSNNSLSYIVQPLTYICKKSFESGIFPDEIKIAKIVPLFKNDNRKEFSNYRPMSILPQHS